MDFSSLPAVEAGQVTLLEFTRPWPPGGAGDPTTCISYVVMKRLEGFVLCLPTGFLPSDALQEGLVNDSPEGLGPSLELEASAVRLAPSGEWIAAGTDEAIGAIVVDLPSELASALAVPDLAAFAGVPFLAEDPGLFPLASEVLQQAREWAAEVLHEARSGYQTAVEEPLPLQRSKPKAKRITVATLAQDQAALQELVRGMAKQLATLLPSTAGGNTLAQGPAVAPPPGLPGLPACPAATGLSAPLASVLPPAQHGQNLSTSWWGRPLRLVPGPSFPRRLAAARRPGRRAAAVLAQSNALVSLVGQLAQGSSEPMLDGPSTTSVRGVLGRQKLQQELASTPGLFSQRIRGPAYEPHGPCGGGLRHHGQVPRKVRRIWKAAHLGPACLDDCPGRRPPRPGLAGEVCRLAGPDAACHRSGQPGPW